MQIEITELAYQEFIDGIEYYEAQLEGLGLRFKESIVQGFERIKKHPEAWEAYSGNTRKYTIGKFPYKIIYTIDNDKIYIIAVANSHQNPDYLIDENRL